LSKEGEVILSKLRVYQIARDFQISSEALLEILRGLNVEVKSHMSTVDDDVIERVRRKFQAEQEAVKAEDARKQQAKLHAEKQARDQATQRRAATPQAPAPAVPGSAGVADARRGAPAQAPGRMGGGGGPAGKRKDRKKKRPVDDRLIRDSVKKTLATIETGGRKHRRRRVREDGSVAVEEEKVIRVSEFITVSELADNLEVKPTEVIAASMRLGIMATLNHRLDRTAIEAVADEFGYGVEFITDEDEEEGVEEAVVEEAQTPRPPVVTIMGHVDHGKTSLLDYIRRTNVVAGEVGGITQHIGAYEVTLPDGGSVTFLDTPGHEAFTAMRARGAQATDIVVLVVAADSRVMPQTIEAIDHAKAAEVPIVVAINKIDLPEANPLLIKQELAGHGLLVEEYGGKTVCAEISAKKGIGVDKLLELILLQAEILELTANADRPAHGVVIESRVEQGRGIVGTVLVQEGTLHIGDPFVCGTQFGKVRAMSNERGQRVDVAGPSTPVEVLGWSGTPLAGDVFKGTANEQQARSISHERSMRQREAVRRRGRVSLTDFFSLVQEGETSELRIVLKADVGGSLEVLSEQLQKLGSDEVKCVIIHSGVGQITENDVNLAAASNAIIIGFHVRPDPRTIELARREKVDIRLYEIIYEVTTQVKSALSGMLKPEEVERIDGTAEVRQVFAVSRTGNIAGCMVQSGTIQRSSRVRLRREGEVVFEGKISSLKRFKDDAKEVAAGFECGIALEGHGDLRAGDSIEAYHIEQIARVFQ
jgi:translation initiation factor IF-2